LPGEELGVMDPPGVVAWPTRLQSLQPGSEPSHELVQAEAMSKVRVDHVHCECESFEAAVLLRPSTHPSSFFCFGRVAQRRAHPATPDWRVSSQAELDVPQEAYGTPNPRSLLVESSDLRGEDSSLQLCPKKNNS
jgi:hypothetical protein